MESVISLNRQKGRLNRMSGDFQQKEELLQVPGMNRTLLKKWDKFFILEGIGGKDCTC